MTGVSGHGQIGEEYEGGHRTRNEVGGERLVVMHEESKLRVWIGEIESLISNELEVFKEFDVGLFGVFFFEPGPRFSCSFLLDLFPDSDIQGSVKDSHSLGIGIDPVSILSVKFGQEMIVVAHADVILSPHGIETIDGGGI